MLSVVRKVAVLYDVPGNATWRLSSRRCDGDGDTAATATDVDDARLVGTAEYANGFFDETFGLGTGDENRGGNSQAQAVELVGPDNVLNRNSAASSLDKLEEVTRRSRRDGLVKPSQKRFSRAAKRMPQQKLCLES